jgi:hypothetical protein
LNHFMKDDLRISMSCLARNWQLYRLFALKQQWSALCRGFCMIDGNRYFRVLVNHLPGEITKRQW